MTWLGRDLLDEKVWAQPIKQGTDNLMLAESPKPEGAAVSLGLRGVDVPPYFPLHPFQHTEARAPYCDSNKPTLLSHATFSIQNASDVTQFKVGKIANSVQGFGIGLISPSYYLSAQSNLSRLEVYGVQASTRKSLLNVGGSFVCLVEPAQPQRFPMTPAPYPSTWLGQGQPMQLVAHALKRAAQYIGHFFSAQALTSHLSDALFLFIRPLAPHLWHLSVV